MILKVFEHEFFLAWYGAVFYYVIVWSMARNSVHEYNKNLEPGQKRQKFTFKAWFDEHYDDMLVTLMVIPLVIIFDDESIVLYNSIFEKDIENLGALVYIMAGPLTNLLYLGVKKLRDKTTV
jgi:hypothetical protein